MFCNKNKPAPLKFLSLFFSGYVICSNTNSERQGSKCNLFNVLVQEADK